MLAFRSVYQAIKVLLGIGEPSGKKQSFASYNWCIGILTLALLRPGGVIGHVSGSAHAENLPALARAGVFVRC